MGWAGGVSLRPDAFIWNSDFHQRRADVAARRRRWQDTLMLRDARGYVFVDEYGVTTDLLRRYGRSPRGVPLRDQPRMVIGTRTRWWRRCASMAGRRPPSSMAGSTIPHFWPTSSRSWFRHSARRCRHARQPRHAQTTGGRSGDRRRRCASAFPAALRPYFNPIELAFAKLKAFRGAARPRNFDQVAELVANALHLFTPQECLNLVRHCGYRVTTRR